ncbi:MAG: hypothetical protein IKY80_06770 [Alistipes sp.]|nr:hypothetical protein [Alistipes sp.]
MRFKFVRIGNVVSWTPAVVKRYPMISYVVMFIIYVLISKFCFGEEDNPTWFNILFFVISGWAYAAMDNQLPTKRYRDLAILLATFFLLFGSLAFKDLVLNKNAELDTVDYSIIIAVTLLPLGYGIYCLWKLRKQKILVADRAQHIDQIRKRRKTR